MDPFSDKCTAASVMESVMACVRSQDKLAACIAEWQEHQQAKTQ
jgi:hypothetical protein